MQDRSAFYARVTERLFKGSLPGWQREPLDRLIDVGAERGRSLEEVAYVLATAHHETGRFKYMEEIGRGEGRDYGESVLVARGRRETYHGRGFVQVTWLANYAKMGMLIGVDLVNEPEKAKEPATAAAVIWEGMIRGLFTGKSLADYIRPGDVDFVEARRIVNGTDQASTIAAYAEEYAAALGLIGEGAAEPETCPRSDCPMRPA